MKHYAVKWFILLAVHTNVICAIKFTLENRSLTVMEGSCVEIKCKVDHLVNTLGAYWFWIKDAKYEEEKKTYTGTIIYSTNESKRSVSPQFKNRVKYTGSPSTSWDDNKTSPHYCSILMCDLNKTDSGNYRFRFDDHGTNKWITEPPTNLSIIENPCPITFKKSPAEKENDTVTLTCSTISSCQSRLQISDLTQQLSSSGNNIYPTSNIITHRFKANWTEHGKVFSCKTHNNIDRYLIRNITLTVKYGPKEVKATTSSNKVKENVSVTLRCSAKGSPNVTFQWFRDNVYNSSGSEMTFTSIKRSDSGSYYCEAQNEYGTAKSNTLNIDVLFPPTNIQLTLPSKVRENQTITISCSAESSPPSTFEIKRSSSPEHSSLKPDNEQNLPTHTFNVTVAHTGFYICIATNSEGKNKSSERKLDVEYPPKDVKIKAQNGLEVLENGTFSLSCTGHSNPSITSYRWIKITDNKNIGQTSVYSVKSASLSDGGLYRCEAKNEIGAGQSQQVEVKIMYAPKLTTIIKGKELQLTDETQSVTLSCISHSYPAAKFKWYRKVGDKAVSQEQSLKVYSHEAGEYFCTAENEFGKTRSDSIKLFDDGGKMVKIFIFSFLIILVILLIIFLNRRNKSNQRRTTNTRPFCGFLVCWNGSWRRAVRNETILAEPFRSRDDLLPEQPCRLNAQCSQPRPDITPASDVNSVYVTVNLPHKNQSPSAQKPGHQRELVEDDSVNYASLHFLKKKKPEEETVYSQVCKPKPSKENKESKVYENFNMINSAKPSYSYEDDSDTSEDEVELSYTKVNFQPKPGHQRATRDPSSSEEDTQYSQVKF